jgi:starch-binding outer membrane protein, SusD/RagB family
MKKINKILTLALLASVSITSCKKQLDLPSRNSIVASIARGDKNGIEGAINSVYSILKRESHYGRDLFSIPEAMADVAFANGRSSRLVGENRNTSLSNITTALWTGSYAAINEINLILEAMPESKGSTAADQIRWEGELKFLRALYLFDLVKNYSYIPTFVVASQDRGGVVINLKGFNTPATAAAYYPSRATIADCYNQIMSDLYRSIVLLPNNGRGGSTGMNYASKHAALALGSRVRLYEGSWAKADSFATAAITLTGGLGNMTTTSNYVSGWRAANHPEAIFQVWYATLGENLGVNTSLAATHTTLAAPGTTNAFWTTRQGQGDLVPNAFLLGQLGITGHNFATSLSVSSTQPTTANPAGVPPPTLVYSNDIRNRLFEWGTNTSGHYVESTKWFGKNGGPNWDNTVVLRWPELYLNRAEARFQQNNEAGAWADLNVIRTARYVGFTVPPTPLTGQALLDEILRQRMLEFAFEGQRFYDLKRYGLNIVKTNPATNLPATDFRVLPRIPLTEVDGNINLKQNFGY